MKLGAKLRSFTLLVICGLSILTSHVIASTPSEWDEHTRMVTARCIKASNLKAVTSVVSRPIEFSDEVGYTALLLLGLYPQPHMENQKGRELCLFNKKTQKAYINEIDGYQ